MKTETGLPLTKTQLKLQLTGLRKARTLLGEQSKWIKNYEGRDAHGEGVRATDPSAVQWCAIGAIKVGRTAQGLCYEALIRQIKLDPGWLQYDRIGIGSIAEVNDYLGYEAVLEMFDRAIEKTELELSLISQRG